MSNQSNFLDINYSRTLVLRPAKPAKRETSDLGSSVHDSVDHSPSFASATTATSRDPVWFGADFDEPRSYSFVNRRLSTVANNEPLTVAVVAVAARAPCNGEGKKAAGDGTNRTVGESSSQISLRTGRGGGGGGGGIDTNSRASRRRRRKMVKTTKEKPLGRTPVLLGHHRRLRSVRRPVQNSATVSRLTSPRGAAGVGNGPPRASQSISGKKWPSGGNKKSTAVQSGSSPRAPNDSRIPVLVRSQTPASHPPCGTHASPQPTACEMHLSTIGERANARDRVTSRKTPTTTTTITATPAVVQQLLSVEGTSRVVEGSVFRKGIGRMIALGGEPSEKIPVSGIVTDNGTRGLRPSPSAGKVSTPSSATSSRVTVQNAAETFGKSDDPNKDSLDSVKALRQQKAFLIHQNRMRRKHAHPPPPPPHIFPPRTAAIVRPRQTGSKPRIIGAPAYGEMNSRRRGSTECHSPPPPAVNRNAAAIQVGATQEKRRSDKKCNDATAEDSGAMESGTVVPPPHPSSPLLHPPLSPLEISSSFSIESSLESPMSTQRSHVSDGQWIHGHRDRRPPMSLRLGTDAAAAAAATATAAAALEGSDLMQRWITSVLLPSNLSDELSDTDALSNPGDIYRQAKSLLGSYGGYQALYDSAGSSPKSPANGGAEKDAAAATKTTTTTGSGGRNLAIARAVTPDPNPPASLSRIAVKGAVSCRRPARGSATVGRSESLNLWSRNRSSVASPRSVADCAVFSSSGLSGSAPPPRRNTHMERCNRPRVIPVHGHSSTAGSSREVTPRKPPRGRCKKAPPPPAETATKNTADEKEEEEEEEEAGKERKEDETPEESSAPTALSAGELIPARFAVFSIFTVSDDDDEELPEEIAPWASVTATERNTEEEEEGEEGEFGICRVCPVNFGVVVAVDDAGGQVAVEVTVVRSKGELSLSTSKENGVRPASKPSSTASANVPPSVANTAAAAAAVVSSEAAATRAERGIAGDTKGNSGLCPPTTTTVPPPPPPPPPPPKAGKASSDDVCWSVLSGESMFKESEVEPRKAALAKIAHLPGTIEQQVITVTEFQDSEIELNHGMEGGAGGGGMRFRIPVLKKIISVIPTWVVNSTATVSPSTDGAGETKEKKRKRKTERERETEGRAAPAGAAGRLAMATKKSYSVVDVTFTDLDGKSFAAVKQQLDQPAAAAAAAAAAADRKRDRKRKSSKRHRRRHHSPRKSEKQPTTTTTTSGADPTVDYARRQAAKNTAKALLQLLQSEFLKQRFEDEWVKDKGHKKKKRRSDAAGLKHGGEQGGRRRRRLPVMPSFDELSSASASAAAAAAPSRTTAVPIHDPLIRTASVDTTGLLLDRSVPRDSANSLAQFPLGSSVTQVFSKRHSGAAGGSGGAGYRASKWSTSLYAKTIYFENQYHQMDAPRQPMDMNEDANVQETGCRNCVEERWLAKEDMATSFLHSDDDGIGAK